jgi:deazaflavin-dependent oxidoreductase (nitroreductase family)
MEKHRVSIFQSLVQKFATTRPGAWLFRHTAHHLDRAYMKLTGSRKTLVTLVAGLPAMIVTTTGAKSGLPRSLPLVALRNPDDESQLVLVASGFGKHRFPGWYHNLKAHPHAVCSLDGKSQAYQAREAVGEEYDIYWRMAVQLYPGYEAYRRRAGRRIPIMVLEEEA